MESPVSEMAAQMAVPIAEGSVSAVVAVPMEALMAVRMVELTGAPMVVPMEVLTAARMVVPMEVLTAARMVAQMAVQMVELTAALTVVQTAVPAGKA